MKCIVPLAGPDVYSADRGFRPLVMYEETCLIERALDSRPWAAQLSPRDYIFVTRSDLGDGQLDAFLARHWPGSANVKLPSVTDGAMLSALAAIALCPDDRPIIVDLADILFQCEPLERIEFTRSTGAIVPTFQSQEAIYSYLQEEQGRVVRAAEKRVIGTKASAGVYMFRSRELYMSAAAHSIRNRSSLQHNGLYFVCPMVNGILEMGYEVEAVPVTDVVPVSKLFH
jgi:hypothetical protein